MSPRESSPEEHAFGSNKSRACLDAEARIIEAVLDTPKDDGGFKIDLLDSKTREHLDVCDRCRAFLKDLLELQEAVVLDRETAHDRGRELVEARLALPAIQSAIDQGLERRNAAYRQKGASLAENLAFAAFAFLVLLVQAFTLTRLRPEVALGLEAGLNWLAPFVFYVIFRLDQRRTARAAQAEGSYPASRDNEEGLR
ncbi:MAG: hypothetical protein ACM3WU_03520 [Bacillota bacterium]